MHGSHTACDPALRELRKKRCRGRLCVRRNGQTGKTRTFVVAAGLGPDHNLGVYNNNVDTIERAFTERYFLCKDGEGFRPAFRVGSGAYRTPEFSDFRNQVLSNMPRLSVMTSAQVVDCYRGAKRKVYEQAHLSLQMDRLTQRDARLTSFVKFEKQDVGKAPRVINPRSARYNLRLGKYLKHAEHHYFRAINSAFGGHTRATVIKGYNADDSADILRAKWDRFKRPVAVGLDATKFDMHVSVPALKYEHSFYTGLFPGNRELPKLLRWQLINKGTAYALDGRVDFEMHGTRSSGDLNTSLGNCLLMCSLVWVYARELGVEIELANNGDDCVVFMEEDSLRTFVDALSRWFRRRGFAMQVEDPVFEFEQLEFCQTHPVQLTTGWRMVRNVSSALRKDPMCLVPVPTERVFRRWLDAVGTCGGDLASGVPVLQSFYRVFKRAGLPAGKLLQEVYKNRSQLQLAAGLKKSDVIDARARVSFYYAFGLSPDYQRVLERIFDSARLDVVVASTIERAALVLDPGYNVE